MTIRQTVTHSDEALNQWGEVFAQNDYAKYMTFDQFMVAPELHQARIEKGSARPLLLSQRAVANAIDRALIGGNCKRRFAS